MPTTAVQLAPVYCM